LVRHASVPENEDFDVGTRVTWGPENQPGKIVRFRGYAMDHNWYVVQLDSGQTVSVRGDQVHPESVGYSHIPTVPDAPPSNWQQVPTADNASQLDALVHHASTPHEDDDVWVESHAAAA
jgi:hypothetical protein